MNTNNDRGFFRVVWAGVFISFLLVGYKLLFDTAEVTSGPAPTVLHTYLRVPWQWFGAAYLLFAVMLCNWRTRFLGYFLPALLAVLYAGTQLFYTVLPGRATNILTAGQIVCIPLLLFVGARWARRAAASRRRR